ncbi:MAG: hypothetical protein HY077_03745 [Elusimicrobia bacterium]|nr:hypothetical protein [Elusimicrobiota bacterium]
MPAASSDNEPAVVDLTRSQQLLVVALNYIPFLEAVSAAAILAFSSGTLPCRALESILFLYLVPPLSTRILFAVFGRPEGRIPAGERAFFVWWASLQLQIVFCRFPGLEEGLRLLPGVYSVWLRLWGSRIGRLTYWSPGTAVLDRSYLNIGDDVTFGAGVRLNGHVLAKNERGRVELLLAPIIIGDRASVGGYSLLTSGTEVAADEATKATLLSPPFSVWKDGHRVRK